MRFRRALVVSVFAALALYVGSSFLTGAGDVLGAVTRIEMRVWTVVLALSLLNYFLRFCRWQWYLAHLGHRLPPWPGHGGSPSQSGQWPKILPTSRACQRKP